MQTPNGAVRVRLIVRENKIIKEIIKTKEAILVADIVVIEVMGHENAKAAIHIKVA